VPVHMHVGSPEMAIDPPSLSMDLDEGGVTDSTLWIINSGEADLHVDLSGDSSWLLPIPDVLTVPPADSVELTVRADGATLLPAITAPA